MTFALDFDDTFTADPPCFAALIELAKQHGHKVLIVTARHRTEENIREIMEATELSRGSIYLTSLQPKMWYMQEQGVHIDVWIDDNPNAVVNGH
jgi:hydroxymethylpyrimidine pyrophosphatase-like HAD family hydrolase